MPDKYVGMVVTIIYCDRSGRITQRRIRVDAVQGERVKAFDLEKRAPRVFRIAHILAVMPDQRTA
ncbi:hypothetical protein [Paenibacillus sp. GCM10023250]|uniref:hypothetical protein n=1 Tax=Paenibacillus sp. GCM10023250 TaxID=3252648 RepID=UPI0036187E96